jgi:hypothetical protein
MSDTDRFPRTLRVGILVFDGFEPIDVWGFVEAFSISRFIGTNYFSPPPYPFEVVLISNQCKPDGAEAATPAPVKSANGPRVAPDYFRDEALEQKIDLLMIPGGGGEACAPPLGAADGRAGRDPVFRLHRCRDPGRGRAPRRQAGRHESRGLWMGDRLGSASSLGQCFALG